MGKKCSIFLAILCASAVSKASAHDFQFNTSIDYNSAYISDGMQCGENTLFLDANLDSGPWNIGITFIKPFAGSEERFNNELDLYLSHNFVITDKVDVEVGATYYTTTEENHHKENSGAFWKEKTFAPYTRVTFNEEWGSPSLTLKHNLNADTTYARADFSRNFPITDKLSLNSQIGFGYAWHVTNIITDRDYAFGEAGISFQYTVNNISAYAGVDMAFANKKNFYGRNSLDQLSLNKDKKFGVSFGISTYF